MRLRGRVGFVFQQFNLFPHRSVLGNVMEGPVTVLGRRATKPCGRPASCSRVGLEGEWDQMPDQLSGGQQQRVAIARALAMQPAVLLFDEPTSALDPRTAGEMESVVADLARSGQTMVIVTHSAGFARRTASTLHVMADGRDHREQGRRPGAVGASRGRHATIAGGQRRVIAGPANEQPRYSGHSAAAPRLGVFRQDGEGHQIRGQKAADRFLVAQFTLERDLPFAIDRQAVSAGGTLSVARVSFPSVWSAGTLVSGTSMPGGKGNRDH